MRIEGLQATADLIGRRIRVRWDLVPEGAETLADAPPVLLRRKERDFDFPPPPAAGADPFLVYDSGAFPPAGPPATVTDLPGRETRDGALRTVWTAISVAMPFSGRMVEVLRRTLATTYGPDGLPVRQRVEILDLGGLPGALQPRRTYYYQLFSALFPPDGDPAPRRSTATATEGYGLNRTLYESLPEIYRRHDVVARPPGPGSDTVPEAAPRSGQLRRFVDLFGTALDSLRGTAEGLRDLRDIDQVDPRYLPLLARWSGWDLSFDADIPLQRNELKAAPRIFRSVGTVPGLRAIVTHYTGWTTQVAEFGQHILRANHPPQLNVYASVEVGGKLRGIDDASAALGFGPGNTTAQGSGASPALLTGTLAGPFALRPGMGLGVAVDGGDAVTVRFGAADFADIRAVTAAEVAAALGRELTDLKVEVSAGGALALRSPSVGPDSSVEVQGTAWSLVSLDGAPGGRPGAVRDAADRLRLFYDVREPLAPDLMPGAPSRPGSDGGAAARILYKTLADGAWLDAHPLPASLAPRASPAAVLLPGDGRLWLAFVENPDTPGSRLRVAFGTARPEQPARLLGRRSASFALVPGAKLTLTGSFSGTDTFVVKAGDYADPAHATAAEVVAAMAAQLTRASAVALPNGTLRLESAAKGAAVRLAIDLGRSSTARALGFGPQNAAGQGQWDEELDWSDPQEVDALLPGRHADPAALVDPDGSVRLFWAHHRDGLWRIVSARWDGRAWFATAGGVNALLPGGTFARYTVADGLPGNDVRGIAVDARGDAYFATGLGVGIRRSDGTWSTFNAAGGLASNDVRAVALDAAGTAWFATAGGASLRREDGGHATFNTASGLPSNDVRAVAVAEDGSVWFGTAAGVGVRGPGGAWRTLLPGVGVRAIAFAPDGTVWLGTGTGLALVDAGGAATVLPPDPGLASSDVRALAVGVDGAVWLGTALGLAVRWPGGMFQIFSVTEGLVGNDVRAVRVAPDGAVWAATDRGASVRRPDGTFAAYTSAVGLASDDVRAVYGPWSAARELAAGGGGNREPVVLRDGSNRSWLIYAQRQQVGTPEDTWLLRYRLFDPVGRAWGPEQALTAVAMGARATDREPAALAVDADKVRVFFRSDRGGGTHLWSIVVSEGGTITGPVQHTEEAEATAAPAPLRLSSGELWLFHRSDRSLSLSQVGVPPPTAGTARVADPGSLRRYAGSTSLVAGDLGRFRGRRLWGDLLAYTPQKPGGEPLSDDELYTRGTIGLYIGGSSRGNPLTQQEADRLRQLLGSFLPINVRAVLILRPMPVVELVYTAAADIGESYRDVYPFADVYTGLADSTAAALPGWSVLLSTTAGHVSVKPSDPTTLRHRSFYYPPK